MADNVFNIDEEPVPFVSGQTILEAAKAAGVPDPIRIINLDEAMRKYADLQNADPAIVFTEDEVKAHDDMRNKAAQAQQGQQSAMAAVEAAKSLGNTSVQPGTALGAILSRGGGAPLNPTPGV